MLALTNRKQRGQQQGARMKDARWAGKSQARVWGQQRQGETTGHSAV